MQMHGAGRQRCRCCCCWQLPQPAASCTSCIEYRHSDLCVSFHRSCCNFKGTTSYCSTHEQASRMVAAFWSCNSLWQLHGKQTYNLHITDKKVVIIDSRLLPSYLQAALQLPLHRCHQVIVNLHGCCRHDRCSALLCRRSGSPRIAAVASGGGGGPAGLATSRWFHGWRCFTLLLLPLGLVLLPFSHKPALRLVGRELSGVQADSVRGAARVLRAINVQKRASGQGSRVQPSQHLFADSTHVSGPNRYRIVGRRVRSSQKETAAWRGRLAWRRRGATSTTLRACSNGLYRYRPERRQPWSIRSWYA